MLDRALPIGVFAALSVEQSNLLLALVGGFGRGAYGFRLRNPSAEPFPKAFPDFEAGLRHAR